MKATEARCGLCGDTDSRDRLTPIYGVSSPKTFNLLERFLCRSCVEAVQYSVKTRTGNR